MLLVLVSCTPITGPQAGNGTIPPAFFLNQNYPNPLQIQQTLIMAFPSPAARILS